MRGSHGVLGPDEQRCTSLTSVPEQFVMERVGDTLPERIPRDIVTNRARQRRRVLG